MLRDLSSVESSCPVNMLVPVNDCTNAVGDDITSAVAQVGAASAAAGGNRNVTPTEPIQASPDTLVVKLSTLCAVSLVSVVALESAVRSAFFSKSNSCCIKLCVSDVLIYDSVVYPYFALAVSIVV